MVRKLTLYCIFIVMLTFPAFSQNINRLSVDLRDQNGDFIVGIISLIDSRGKEVARINYTETKKTLTINSAVGSYTLEIQSPGFKPYKEIIEIKRGENNIKVRLEIEQINVNVEVELKEQEKRMEEAIGGYLSEREIADLPESGEDIKEELQRRYGDDILIRIDGDFEGSQIPPREQISSIKIIRNTFDAEFHEIVAVVIDIRTKVGTSGFHGFASLSFNDSRFNARNPFDAKRQPEQKNTLLLFLSGPIIQKKTSFSLSTFGIGGFDTRNFLGTIPDANEAGNRKIKNQIRLSTFGIKHNLPNEHLLNLKYQINEISFFRLGPFDLPERASTFSTPRHTFSLNESGTFRKKYINEIRFQFGKEFKKIVPENDNVTIIVLDAFARGSSGINLRDEAAKFKLSDNLAFDAGGHSLKLGAEIEYEKFNSVSENNLNGRFIFSSLANFQNQTPSQYSQTLSATNVNFSQSRAAFYFQDYFKLRKTLQFGLGLRYERQSDLEDGNNISPRIGYVWSPEKSGKFIVRGGVGVFYDWLDTNALSAILGNNGQQGQNLIILNPSFPNPFDGGTVSQPLPVSISKLADNLTNP